MSPSPFCRIRENVAECAKKTTSLSPLSLPISVTFVPMFLLLLDFDTFVLGLQDANVVCLPSPTRHGAFIVFCRDLVTCLSRHNESEITTPALPPSSSFFVKMSSPITRFWRTKCISSRRRKKCRLPLCCQFLFGCNLGTAIGDTKYPVLIWQIGIFFCRSKIAFLESDSAWVPSIFLF